MTQMMSRPWPEVGSRYTEAPSFAWTNGMLALVDHLSGTTLHAWTSMFDLCVTQVPTTYPYAGPVVKVCPIPDTTLLELQWPGDQIHVIPADDAVATFERLANQFSWHKDS